MHQSKIIVVISLLLLSGCIKSFDPKIESKEKNKYVVSGRVTNTEGWQEVEISLTSPIGDPVFIPVSGCEVKILDNNATVFQMDEYNAGFYRVWMDKEYLTPGSSFKVIITTPGGEELVSGFDTMPKGPGLDSVYYLLQNIPTTDPGVNQRVMQFYVDLDAVGDYSRYYKWEIEEAWEYNAAYPVEYYYDGKHHKVIPPDYSMYTCWSSGLVKNVFTVSTKNLSQNMYKRYPLHRIDGHTSRLGILYSILVRQLALSEEAYNYWEKLRVNSNDQGGLYEKQPLNIKGNISDVKNPDKPVLGYFYAATESSRRYFYKDIDGIMLDFENGCWYDTLGAGGFRAYDTWEYPIYYFYEGFALRVLTIGCVDCRHMGGTTEKPDFWPK